MSMYDQNLTQSLPVFPNEFSHRLFIRLGTARKPISNAIASRGGKHLPHFCMHL